MVLQKTLNSNLCDSIRQALNSQGHLTDMISKVSSDNEQKSDHKAPHWNLPPDPARTGFVEDSECS